MEERPQMRHQVVLRDEAQIVTIPKNRKGVRVIAKNQLGRQLIYRSKGSVFIEIFQELFKNDLSLGVEPCKDRRGDHFFEQGQAFTQALRQKPAGKDDQIGECCGVGLRPDPVESMGELF